MAFRPVYRRVIAVAALAASALGAAQAEEPRTTKPPDVPAAGGIDGTASRMDTQSARLQHWIEQLGAADFRERELATQQLVAAGPDAVDALVSAAKTSDLEVSYRIVEILRSLLESRDSNTEQRVLGALEAMAANKTLPTADLAGDVLNVF